MRFFIFLFLFISLFSFAQDNDSIKILYESIAGYIEKIENPKILIIPFASLDNNPKDGLVLSERLFNYLFKLGKYNIVDYMQFSSIVKDFSFLNESIAKKIFDEQKINIIISGSVLRKDNKLEANIRVIRSDDFRIIGISNLDLNMDWLEGSLKDIKKEIKRVRFCTDREIEKIAEENKPNPQAKYYPAYFPCGMAPSYCEKFNLKNGFYSIFFDDPRKTVIKVDKDTCEILERYYSHPNREDF